MAIETPPITDLADLAQAKALHWLVHSEQVTTDSPDVPTTLNLLANSGYQFLLKEPDRNQSVMKETLRIYLSSTAPSTAVRRIFVDRDIEPNISDITILAIQIIARYTTPADSVPSARDIAEYVGDEEQSATTKCNAFQSLVREMIGVLITEYRPDLQGKVAFVEMQCLTSVDVGYTRPGFMPHTEIGMISWDGENLVISIIDPYWLSALGVNHEQASIDFNTTTPRFGDYVLWLAETYVESLSSAQEKNDARPLFQQMIREILAAEQNPLQKLTLASALTAHTRIAALHMGVAEVESVAQIVSDLLNSVYERVTANQIVLVPFVYKLLQIAYYYGYIANDLLDGFINWVGQVLSSPREATDSIADNPALIYGLRRQLFEEPFDLYETVVTGEPDPEKMEDARIAYTTHMLRVIARVNIPHMSLDHVFSSFIIRLNRSDSRLAIKLKEELATAFGD